MKPRTESDRLRLALPKGRMFAGVSELLADAGVQVRSGAREYRPSISLPDFDVKILKPQAIVTMLQVGSRDIGFTGADWVAEFGAPLEMLLDTGLDPVRVVAAAPADRVLDGRLSGERLVVASELEQLTQRWIEARRYDARFVRTFGATEVYPPDDADGIVDVVATGSTLRANGLVIVDELMASSTRLYANPDALRSPTLRPRIDDLVTLLRSVLDARRRVMVELNVSADRMEQVIAILPCMREPTISPLHGNAGFAVKAAVPKEELPALIPRVKALGGSDIVVSKLAQIVA